MWCQETTTYSSVAIAMACEIPLLVSQKGQTPRPRKVAVEPNVPFETYSVARVEAERKANWSSSHNIPVQAQAWYAGIVNQPSCDGLRWTAMDWWTAVDRDVLLWPPLALFATLLWPVSSQSLSHWNPLDIHNLVV